MHNVTFLIELAIGGPIAVGLGVTLAMLIKGNQGKDKRKKK